MIAHVFNSSSVSGPEQLVLPALSRYAQAFTIINLVETRLCPQLNEDPLRSACETLGLSYYAVPVRSRWDRQALELLNACLQKINPTLIHAHGIKASLYTRRAAVRVPRVSTHHGVRGLPDWKVRVYEWVYRKRWLPDFDRTLCVSSSDYADLQKSGLPSEKLRLHLNGADRRRVPETLRKEEATRIRTAWFPGETIPPDAFWMAVVGRLSAEKDHARLFRTLAHLKSLPTDVPWQCLVFGQGALEPALRKQVQPLGLEHHVRWMGFRKTIGNEMAGVDLLLSFSKAEGLPINVVEAGWAGTPVLATRVGGLMDLVPDDTHGFLFAPSLSDRGVAEQMQRLIARSQESMLRSAGQRFQDRVCKEFTQPRWIERLREIYAELGVSF